MISVYVGEEEYIVSSFKHEKSKFINETIEFNLRSSYILTDCVEEKGELKITQKRFYKNCPLPIKPTDARSIFVESRCNPVGTYKHQQIVESGIYIPWGIYNNRILYRKPNPDCNGMFWFLYYIIGNGYSWQVGFNSSPDYFDSKTKTCVFGQNKGYVAKNQPKLYVIA